MDEILAQSAANADNHPQDAADVPPGDHPLEVAARRGIGPLSARAEKKWHGDARPCVSCGLLVLRDQRECDNCGQDLSDEMLEKMRAHAGPWYVLEHLRPFPGVSLERIIRQIRRGLLTETSIVRGPATDFQWRFAVETPGLCRYFGMCWNCHQSVAASDAYCAACLAYLSHDAPVAAQSQVPGTDVAAAESTTATQSPTGTQRPAAETIVESPSLQELSAALQGPAIPKREPVWDEPPRIGPFRATWVAVFVIILVIAGLFWVTQERAQSTQSTPSGTIGCVQPAHDAAAPAAHT